MRKKVLVIFGTRPEAIKMSAVIRELKTRANLRTEICITAQHRHMLDQVLNVFKIRPDYDLDIMKKNQDLFNLTAKSLIQLKTIMTKSKPDIILVQGDTTTTFIASLAGFYLKIPIGYVEAGLRTYNKYSPFPEEMNRCLVTEIADFNFAPTEWARENLLKEGIPESKIFVTGNTVIDALYYVLRVIKSSRMKNKLKKSFYFLKGKSKKIVLITGHRRENFGRGFRNICNAIKKLALSFPECDFVYPVHLNPNVQRPVKNILNKNKLPNIHLIEPLEYLPFVYLMKKSYLILTDSGGVQEEAITFGKPILVMRNITERPEGVEKGAVKLVGTNEEKIFKECKKLIVDEKAYNQMVILKNPYGDGKASKRIVDILIRRLI